MFSCFPSDIDNADLDSITEKAGDSELEVNYDSNHVTYLYQAIEEKAFDAAVKFLQSKKPEVDRGVRTWVTRFEANNNFMARSNGNHRGEPAVRWSQLPIHAAVIFKAPMQVVELLIQRYPRGLRCKDDQEKLPLHLAFKFGSKPEIILLLLEKFPQAMNHKDGKGREPLDLALLEDNDTMRIAKIIRVYLKNKKMDIEDAIIDEEVHVLNSDLQSETKRVRRLQRKNRDLMEAVANSNTELKRLRTELQELKEKQRDTDNSGGERGGERGRSKKGLGSLFRKSRRTQDEEMSPAY